MVDDIYLEGNQQGSETNDLKLKVDNLMNEVYCNALYRGWPTAGASCTRRLTMTNKF